MWHDTGNMPSQAVLKHVERGSDLWLLCRAMGAIESGFNSSRHHGIIGYRLQFPLKDQERSVKSLTLACWLVHSSALEPRITLDTNRHKHTDVQKKPAKLRPRTGRHRNAAQQSLHIHKEGHKWNVDVMIIGRAWNRTSGQFRSRLLPSSPRQRTRTRTT